MSAGDTYTYYDETIINEPQSKPFISKSMQVIYDISNSGTYSNQILFSTGMLINNGKYVDFANSYIIVPMVMAVDAVTTGTGAALDISTGANAAIMGLKNSSLQIVDSLIVQYNGTNVITQSLFTNVIQTFRQMASWTQSDLLKWGASCMFYPDDTQSIGWTATGLSINGSGVWNNNTTNYKNLITATSINWSNSIRNYNRGFLERLRYIGVATNSAATQGNNGLLSYATSSHNTTLGRPQFVQSSTSKYYWQFDLCLRAKDLSEWFAKLPVLKSARIDMTINLNLFSNTISYVCDANAATSATLNEVTYNQISGHSCPYMVSSGHSPVVATALARFMAPNGQLTTAGTAGATLTCGIGVNGISGVSVLSFASGYVSNCRWFIPTYEMNDQYEVDMLEHIPTKTIYYTDFYTYNNITNVTGTFNNLITGGVSNPQWIVIFPFFNSAAASQASTLQRSSYQSCFHSAPATADPIQLNNIQIQCGGVQVWPLIEIYGYQQFMDEFSSIFALNGGKSDITSGLVDKAWWEGAPIYVADLSRRVPEDDNSPKSIQVGATIVSTAPNSATVGATIDIICFVGYKKSCTFNMVSGNLESIT